MLKQLVTQTFFDSEAELPHPVFTCVFHISKSHRNVESTCTNDMCKRPLYVLRQQDVGQAFSCRFVLQAVCHIVELHRRQQGVI